MARVFASPGLPPVLRDAVAQAGLPLVDVPRFAACLMAAVTGEITDRPSAAWATLEGGVAPLVDGLAHAARDAAPMLLLTGAGPDAALLAPVVRASVVVEPASASHWIAHAARSAMNEPRGPSHVSVDPVLLGAPAVPAATSCAPDAPAAPDAAALDALADAVAAARRPLVVAGMGCRAADAPWIRAFAEAMPAPVVATAKGKGVLPDPHALALGAFTAEHPALRRADLLLALGIGDAEAPPGAWPVGTPVATIARSPASAVAMVARIPASAATMAAGSIAPPSVTVIGEIGAVLEELAPRLRDRTRADWDVAEIDRIRRASLTDPPQAGLSLRRAVILARQATPAGTVAAFETPLAAAWQAVAPGECLVPAGFATAGFALPAAMAAALAGRRALAFPTAAGLPAEELEMAVRLGLPVVVIARPTGVRPAGVAVLTATSEQTFEYAFADAWRSARPALVEVAAAG